MLHGKYAQAFDQDSMKAFKVEVLGFSFGKRDA